MFKTPQGDKIYIDKSAMNHSVIITGESGSGKSTALFLLEKDLASQNNEIIVLDYANTHTNCSKCIPVHQINYIDAATDGFDLNLFEASGSTRQDAINMIQDNVSILGCGMGNRERRVLRQVISYGFVIKERRPAFSDNSILELSFSALQKDNSFGNKDTLNDVHDKLWALLSRNILHPSKNVMEGKVNIIDLNSISTPDAIRLCELYMNALWRHKTRNAPPATNNCTSTGTYIVLDEFQILNTNKSSIFQHILRNGRKHGISLLLATQTLQDLSRTQRAVLEQPETKLYFKPSPDEYNTIARKLDSGSPGFWIDILSSLSVGKCVGVGSFDLNGNIIRHPLLLSTDFDPMLNNAIGNNNISYNT